VPETGYWLYPYSVARSYGILAILNIKNYHS
jgi:hypothetical protein